MKSLNCFLLVFGIFSLGCNGEKPQSTGDRTTPVSVKKDFNSMFLLESHLKGYRKNSQNPENDQKTKDAMKKSGVIKSFSNIWVRNDVVIDSRTLFSTAAFTSRYYSGAVRNGMKEFRSIRKCTFTKEDCTILSGTIKHPEGKFQLTGETCLFRVGNVVGRVFLARNSIQVKVDPERINILCKKAYYLSAK
ncbi:MAG: hypothetical protein JXR95_03250 [Deltaproteobacteria bacterium]|nr:hypothetical protein [Deltaproteobacteria bacterium]